jgi:hypothetical protein
MFSHLLSAISQHTDTSDPVFKLLKDDAAYPNTVATKHQYDPVGCRYIASMTEGDFVKEFCKSQQWREHGGNFSGDARAFSKAIIRHCKSLCKSKYQKVVKYKHAKDNNTGRLYDDTMSTQILSSKLRSYLLPDTYHDYDMSNAHPNILLWLCNNLNYKCAYLEEYVIKRAEVLADTGKTKHDILAYINQDKPKKSDNEWIVGFCQELVLNKKKLHTIIDDVYHTDNEQNPTSSKVNKLLCDIENRMLHAGLQAVDAQDPILFFDGFMVQQELTEEQINQLNVATGLIDIEWCEKPWSKPDISDVPEPDASRTYEIQKKLFEKQHFVLNDKGVEYWKETEEGPRPVSRQAFTDSAEPFYYLGGRGGIEECVFFKKWLKDSSKRAYKRIEYVPYAKHCPPELREGTLNTAQPFAFDYIEKADRHGESMAMFRQLLSELSEDENGLNYMTNYFAHMLQRPLERPQIMLMFKSHGGTGKDTLTQTIERMLGTDHCVTVADMDSLFGFNSIIANKLFVTMNEIDGKQGVKHVEGIKNRLTVPEIVITYKGKDSYKQKNSARNVLYSNNNNPMPIDSASGRRVLANQVRADRQLPVSFFDKYYALLDDSHWVNSLASELYDIDLTDFNIRKPPTTASLQTKLQNNIHVVHKLLQDIAEGTHTENVWTKVPKKPDCVAIEKSVFMDEYKARLSDKYPHGYEPFMTDKKWLDGVYGAYNDIIWPSERKSFQKKQRMVMIIHKERMIQGLKNRCEYTTNQHEESDEEELA